MFEPLLRDHIKRYVFQYLAEKSENNKTQNINPFGSPLPEDINQYPDITEKKIKDKIKVIKQIAHENVLLTQGSEEAIDLVFRAFCEPIEDNIIICPPTSDLYEKWAAINNVKIKKVPLDADFQLDITAIAASIDNFTKIIFLCSPNNPTSNALLFSDIEIILNNFDGIVVLDEAYINFSRQRSFLSSLREYPNLIILQTMSKAWGLAGLRIGLTFADEGIINVLECIRPNQALNTSQQNLLLKALDNIDLVNQWTKDTVALRNYLVQRLEQLPLIEKIFPSDANFIFIKINEKDNNVFLQSIENQKNILSSTLPFHYKINIGTLNEIEGLINLMSRLK